MIRLGGGRTARRLGRQRVSFQTRKHGRKKVTSGSVEEVGKKSVEEQIIRVRRKLLSREATYCR